MDTQDNEQKGGWVRKPDEYKLTEKYNVYLSTVDALELADALAIRGRQLGRRLKEADAWREALTDWIKKVRGAGA